MKTIKFNDIKVGSIVKVYDSYIGQYAVGIVEEKKEDYTDKMIGVRFGFSNDLKNPKLQYICVEYKDPDDKRDVTMTVDEIIGEV